MVHPYRVAAAPSGLACPRCHGGGPTGPMYVKCPRCREVMNRRLFAPGAGVVVDVCRGHGTWFDVRELPAVVGFVEAGGLDRAARAPTLEQIGSPPRPAPAPRSPVVNDREVTMASALLDLLRFWS